MKNLFIKFSLILFVALCLAQCNLERDEYYEIPDWVGVSVYETLQKKGGFDLYLKLVDKTQYSVPLKGNGLWTVFAPTDAAVQEWLNKKHGGSIDAVSEADAAKVVAYSMVYNRYMFDQLSHVLGEGKWDSVSSVKKKTPYYETIRREEYPPLSTVPDKCIWVVEANRGWNHYYNDNNYKFLPFYLDDYFKNRQVPLGPDDYNLFYDRAYTGRNIQNASVLDDPAYFNIKTSNGVIHVVDQVNEPLRTIEQLLNDPGYSKFKSLLNLKNPAGEPYFYTYSTNQSFTNTLRQIFPNMDPPIDQAYVKFWTGLSIPINTERFISQYEKYISAEKQAEMSGYTIFAPNDVAMDKFFENVIKYYPDYQNWESLPLPVLQYFINAHLVEGMVWPTMYNTEKNYWEDFINGAGPAGPTFGEHRQRYVDIKPASNGFFFGSDDYVRSRYLETVYSEILLSPNKYGFMFNAMQKYSMNNMREDLVKCQLNAENEVDYTVLLISNEQFAELGISYNMSTDVFDHPSGVAYADELMQRLIRSHVFKRINNDTINTSIKDFHTIPNSLTLNQYDGWAFALNDYGEMVRYKNGEIQMVGNHNAADERVTPTLVDHRPFLNGQLFTIDKLLKFPNPVDCADIENCPEVDMWEYIRRAGLNNPNITGNGSYTSDFSFVNYMRYLMDKDPGLSSARRTTKPLTFSNEQSWTILMPTNAALSRAITAGVLPRLSNILVQMEAGSSTALLDQAIEFFRYHFISGTVLVNDGFNRIVTNTSRTVRPTAVLPYVVLTPKKVNITESTFLSVTKDEDTGLQFTNYHRLRIPAERIRTAKVIPGVNRSNLFGIRTVLHEVDNYLLYEEP